MISEDRIERELALYVTNSGRPPEPTWTDLALRAASQTIPRLLDIAARRVETVDISCYGDPSSGELGDLFRRAGSDKSTEHNYHLFYANILGYRRTEALRIFEVGLGTNHTDVVSSMGEHGTPGASLRAWRDYLPNAQIYGADIDRRILFQEERILTFYADQERLETLLALDVPNLDLVVDDGLHSTHANIAVLYFAMGRLRRDGWLVIEDIRESSLPVWHLVAALLPHSHARLIKGRSSYLFVWQRP